ncbi:YheU family protein, partial [Pseudomonas aeruginosa]
MLRRANNRSRLSAAHPPAHDLLEADTLNNLLEDFVTREGTDNGDETPL